jgi:hypothetical protein
MLGSVSKSSVGRATTVTTAIFVMIAQQVPGCVGFWTKSSPVTPLPKNSVMISNATLNPVAVYECAAPDPSKRTDYVVGALAYEGAWRCMFFDPSSPSNMSSVGPGQYQVSECCRDVGCGGCWDGSRGLMRGFGVLRVIALLWRRLRRECRWLRVDGKEGCGVEKIENLPTRLVISPRCSSSATGREPIHIDLSS